MRSVGSHLVVLPLRRRDEIFLSAAPGLAGTLQSLVYGLLFGLGTEDRSKVNDDHRSIYS